MRSLLQTTLLLSMLKDGVAVSHHQIPFSQDHDAVRTRPNIVFILTDDQDLHMDSLSFMPHLQKHLVQDGTFYPRHYCTIALCCPSRVSLWTGRAAHNTNVTDVNPPYGGYPKFVSQGFNEAWLPLWLQEAGYNTYYTGKLFNAHTVTNYDSPFVSGFNGSDFLLDPYTYQYLNATFQRNQDVPISHQGDYSTDVLAHKAYGFLEDAIAAKNPFFLAIAPSAPHSNVEFTEDWFGNNESTTNILTTPPIPAERHQNLFQDAVVPRTPNFNPDKASGVSWIAKLPKQNQTVVDANDHFYRNRLRALQAVDEIVDGVISRLSTSGHLDNTYIFYSADNGYHIGQHRMQPGKECGFETDINVPLLVRGPGVPKGHTSYDITSHTDLAPTFLSIAGGTIRDDFDGSTIQLPPRHRSEAQTEEDNPIRVRREHVNVEYWGFALAEGEYDRQFFWNNTYKALRLIGEDYNFYYSVWCSGEHQLYDLNTDPWELNNLYDSTNHSSPFHFTWTPKPDVTTRTETAAAAAAVMTTQSTTLNNLVSRLDALLLVLKSCRARSCTHPWETLHPAGDVRDLHDALAGKFDDFYNLEQEKVEFVRCEKGYILESEGPNTPLSFRSAAAMVLRPRGGAMWSELV